MAETYGVFDWRALPPVTAATLAQGLPSTSRVAKKLTGIRCPDEKTVLLAVIADRLGHIGWMFTDDGQKGRNHPPSILEKLMNGEAPEPGFDTAEEYEAAWAAITGSAGGDSNV